tara:strand:+ start:1261 stop:1596 length:336 start_codon:yes stop_codon:yes gene_type:complete
MAYTLNMAASIIQSTYLRSLQRIRYWIEHDTPQKLSYYQRNKEKISLAAMLKYHLNKNGEKQKARDYYLKNKEKIIKKQSIKISCNICGSVVSRSNIYAHKKSKKCLSCII